jgi:hypothetical protein
LVCAKNVPKEPYCCNYLDLYPKLLERKMNTNQMGLLMQH